MFGSAEIKESVTYSAPGEGRTLHLGIEEQGTIGVRFTDNGHVIFFNTDSGNIVHDESLDLPARISSISSNIDLVVLGLENGSALAVQYKFDLSYPNDVRTLTPRLEFPLGKELLLLDESEQALTQVVIQLNEDGIGLAATTADNRLVSARYLREESFISEEVSTELESRSELPFKNAISSIVLTPALEHLYAASAGGTLTDYSLDEDGFDGDKTEYILKHEITRLQLLLCGSSLMIGLDNGEVQQWMSVRKDGGRELTYIRNFHANEKAVTYIATEQQRKGFAVSDTQGDITLYY